ncbi:MAG: GNAT family N-acetyltransferase [Eubacterium sp.]|nr:GNAT family N-acetyltransferase [Eubacterium sp.]
MKDGFYQASVGDVDAIVSYLRPHVKDCIYMYIDIAKYGLDNPNMKVWIDVKDGAINLVAMKYHTSLTVYTDDAEFDMGVIADMMREYDIYSMTARKDLIERVLEKCPDRYDVLYGYVFQLTSFRDYGFDESVIEDGKIEDCKEIAELVMTDEEIGSYYEVENLAKQYAERMETGMGRSYVIRDNGKMVAHIASYAEFDGVATTSGLIVTPEFRNGLYGIALEAYLVKRLMQDGFHVYTYVIKRLRKKFLERMGNECIGEYGKLMIKKEA